MISDDHFPNTFHSDKYPEYGSHLECMTRSLFAGLSAFTIVFSGTFFGQRFIQNNSSYPKKRTLLISASVAALASYYVTSKRTKACRIAWRKTDGK